MRRLLLAAALLPLLVPPALAGDDDAKAGAPAAPKAKPGGEPKKAPPPAAPARSAPRSKKEALAVLDRIVVSVNFDALPLRDAVNYLANVTGTNLVLGPALVRAGDVDAIKVTMRLQKVSVKQVLDLIARSHDLGIGFQSGVLTVTTIQEARGKPVLRMYLVSDITFALRDFPGPEMMLKPSGAEREVEPETETKPAFSDADDILNLVRENTGDGTWQDEGVSASVMKEWLVVRQYEEVHDQIARILALLRAAR